ncbi:MAG: transcription-repair coupling factor [Sulfurimonas sp. RIFOXYD12_FULL_33_39]|uniref:DEAD/DEAH box helicase n=1 Tax=unclassified Sulfurimonas TaxID=2623549 RepID=UPI0008BDD1B7|nr:MULTISPECIES: DEAD/DEAH box helicase [unclassified Sulfurimonas]OHE08685.1 MAG: transcription-repair coupling factor [Sulfurimonas sp. RIFOXYD12_FULL_33_39]OHE13970.1 MAG: transcription-repair coupling factor [Sulfurimonas sp. RIFOXYD2_FULL_34_21]
MSQNILFQYYKTAKNADLEVLICQDSKEAYELESVAKFFKKDVLVFPDFRATFGDDLRVYKEEIHQLFSVLRKYYALKKKPLIISPLKTLLFHMPKESLLSSTTLEFGSKIELKKFQEQMLFWGYSFVDMVQVEGEISFRGDIIDIFPPSSAMPLRISLFDDEIEQIKYFELESQRTQKDELESVEITPAFYSLNEDEFNSLNAKIAKSEFNSLVKDIASLGLWHLDESAANFLDGKNARLIRNLDTALIDAYALNKPTLSRGDFNLEILLSSDEFKELAVTDIHTLVKVHKDKKITVIASNEAVFKQAGLFELKNITQIYAPYILNIITKDELVISLNKPDKVRRRRKSSILLDDLKAGDYVVHEDYGVGIFESIEKTEILGGIKDFIVIKYVGDDKILLPVENLDVIDRYIASGGSVPVLDKLGKGSFGKLKESVKKRLMEIAGQIVNTAAARELIKAPKISVNMSDLREFQKLSGFDYTQDQIQSIDEIIAQMSSGHIMDRLLSGDVGFGKTEVAMNTIFAAYKSGFQSALIVPTTLLSAQHYRSLHDRFDALGIKCSKLDRFVSAKDKKNIISALASGDLDVVVGTHTLFDLDFKNLGVVIIDEEHKFGVKQKERIKELYHNVHLLSMSATPIPRSLNQALSSIKTMSQLLTPPSEREAVRTFVKEYDEKLIKEVILREIRRGGQIFYVHNSIDHMPIKLGELKAILPSLRVVMLHSKISASDTEKELLKFEAGEYDLMLATSIIESGIHMPRVNTIIVDGADRFGMADLHQLRGRVGRGRIEGFAYFIVENKDNLTDEAKKRLLALESNSFLGSGSVLAYHDLEIRGGGNLVGDAQSGHIKNIGYSLYLRLLEDAIKLLSNQAQSEKLKVDIKLTVSAFISDEVVKEDRLRLDIYRRLSSCETPLEIYEIQEEVIDRFGEIDTPTKQFFELMVIKLLSLGKKIKSVSNYGQNITFSYVDEKKESIKSESKDDDDIIKSVLKYLRA